MNRRSCQLKGMVGFTLVELGIVLAIMSVVASTVLPDFIESLKNELALQAADQVQSLHAAARSYYHNSVKDIEVKEFDAQIDPSIAVWPSETEPNTCAIGERKLKNGVPPGLAEGFPGQGNGPPGQAGQSASWPPQVILVDLGLIDVAELENPWGKPIAMRLMPSSSNAIDDEMKKVLCSMVVSTEVPVDMVKIVMSRLPGAHCNNASLCGATESEDDDFVRCCSAMSKPGLEVALETSMVSSYDPADVKIFTPPTAVSP